MIIGILLLGFYSIFTSSSNEYEQCLEELSSKNLVAGTDYVSGEILVGFTKNVSQAEANEILQSEGLHTKDNDTYDIFSPIGVFVVTVEEGKEFEWICKLQENPTINYADIKKTETSGGVQIINRIGTQFS